MHTEAMLFYRRAIFDKYQGFCGICGLVLDFETMHVDHIQPRSKGGPDNFENLRPTHPRCNLSRGNRDQPKEKVAKERKLRAPAPARRVHEPRSPIPDNFEEEWEAGHWLTTMMVAEELDMTYAAIAKTISRGNLPAQRVGREWWVHRRELDRFKALPRKPGPKPRPLA